MPVVSVADYLELPDVQSPGSHLLVIQGYFRGGVWNRRWLGDPKRWGVVPPEPGSLELCRVYLLANAFDSDAGWSVPLGE